MESQPLLLLTRPRVMRHRHAELKKLQVLIMWWSTQTILIAPVTRYVVT